MKIRNIEQKSSLIKEIYHKLNIYDVQGICTVNNEFTMLVEAVDMEDDNINHLKTIFSSTELLAKSRLSKVLDIPFYVIARTKELSRDVIYVFEYKIDQNENLCYEKKYEFKPISFVSWWKENMDSCQYKKFRKRAAKYLEGSYFDNLLKSHNSSWSFNLDGFMIDSQYKKILCLIENRKSNFENLNNYNPAKFFKDDTRVWSSLFNLSLQLNVPLFLQTFSEMDNYKLGIALIENVSEKIKFKDDITPNKNIINSLSQLKEYINVEINNY